MQISTCSCFSCNWKILTMWQRILIKFRRRHLSSQIILHCLRFRLGAAAQWWTKAVSASFEWEFSIWLLSIVRVLKDANFFWLAETESFFRRDVLELYIFVSKKKSHNKTKQKTRNPHTVWRPHKRDCCGYVWCTYLPAPMHETQVITLGLLLAHSALVWQKQEKQSEPHSAATYHCDLLKRPLESEPIRLIHGGIPRHKVFY